MKELARIFDEELMMEFLEMFCHDERIDEDDLQYDGGYGIRAMSDEVIEKLADYAKKCGLDTSLAYYDSFNESIHLEIEDNENEWAVEIRYNRYWGREEW